MKSSRIWVCALASFATVLGGCSGDSAGSAPQKIGASDESTAVARKFGEDVLSGDWTAAHDLGTQKMQFKASASQLRHQYAVFVNQLREISPTYKPGEVQVVSGSLPVDLNEAASSYGMSDPPPISTWRGYFVVAVGQGVEGVIDQGVEAKLLLVDEGGHPKIADVQFNLAGPDATP